MTPFLALLTFLALLVTLAAIGVARGHVIIHLRRKPEPRRTTP